MSIHLLLGIIVQIVIKIYVINNCISHSSHKKISISNFIIKDSKLEEYKNKLNKLKTDYNNFYDECD